jgi:hypothetical protein
MNRIQSTTVGLVRTATRKKCKHNAALAIPAYVVTQSYGIAPGIFVRLQITILLERHSATMSVFLLCMDAVMF